MAKYKCTICGHIYDEEKEKVKFNDLPKLPTSIDGVLCVKPTELYEGFFVAKIRKVNK